MPHVIGFIGLAGAGKDTAAQAMLEGFTRNGQTVVLDSFAAPIREISGLVGMPPDDRAGKECQREVRGDALLPLLHHAIRRVLGKHLPEQERSELYIYTVEALARYLSPHGERGAYLMSPRQFMQALGTEAGQRVRTTLWVDLARQRWRGLPCDVLVPDVRFVHEVRAVDRLVLVHRSGQVATDNHASEALAAQLTAGEWVPGCVVAAHLWNEEGRPTRMTRRARQIASRLARGKHVW